MPGPPAVLTVTVTLSLLLNTVSDAVSCRICTFQAR